MVILLKVRVRIDRSQLLADIAIHCGVHKCHDVLSPTQRTRTRRVVASRRFTRLTNGSPSTISAASMNRSAVRPRWRLACHSSSERLLRGRQRHTSPNSEGSPVCTRFSFFWMKSDCSSSSIWFTCRSRISPKENGPARVNAPARRRPVKGD